MFVCFFFSRDSEVGQEMDGAVLEENQLLSAKDWRPGQRGDPEQPELSNGPCIRTTLDI